MSIAKSQVSMGVRRATHGARPFRSLVFVTERYPAAASNGWVVLDFLAKLGVEMNEPLK